MFAFAGKTHTMIGSPTDIGIIQRAVDHLFDAIEASEGEQFLLRVSYLEIYNEVLTDLLYEVSPLTCPVGLSPLPWTLVC